MTTECRSEFTRLERCATTHRQTTDRKSTRRQKLTDKKIFTDTTTERQRQVADTTTHRQKPIITDVVCGTSKDSDQPAHMHSLIRAFASRWNIR